MTPFKKRCRELEEETNRHRKREKKLESDREALRRKYLMDGPVFHHHQTEKDYLLSALEAHIGSKVIRTPLLYTMDPLNKTNFHKYIDEHWHTVLVVELTSGVIVAAYSEGPFVAKEKSEHDGLLIAATYEKTFALKERNTRAINYEEEYLIYGNSELRIKSGDRMVLSKFGLADSSYDSRGEDVTAFLGCEEREALMEKCQVFQLQFEEEEEY